MGNFREHEGNAPRPSKLATTITKGYNVIYFDTLGGLVNQGVALRSHQITMSLTATVRWWLLHCVLISGFMREAAICKIIDRLVNTSKGLQGLEMADLRMSAIGHLPCA